MENRYKILELLCSSNTRIHATRDLSVSLYGQDEMSSLKATERSIKASSIRFETVTDQSLADEHERPPKRWVLDQLLNTARKKRKLILFAQALAVANETHFLALNDASGGRRWARLDATKDPTTALTEVLTCLCDFISSSSHADQLWQACEN